MISSAQRSEASERPAPRRRTAVRAVAALLVALTAIAGASAADTPARSFEQAYARMHAEMATGDSDDADRLFATGMIPHHRGAIDMARILLEHGRDPELRALAEEIVAAQSREIAFLQDWLARHPETAAPPAAGSSHSPYAGMERRPLKALSAEQEEDLRAGRGMGMALAAELNGYPGPAHVLDLAEELSLTPEQIAATRALRAEVSDDAVRLGAEILKSEEALDRLFASGAAEPESLRSQAVEIGRLQGELRFLHLNAHLAMRGLLTPEQAAEYARLRGHEGPAAHGQHHGQHEAQ